MPEEASSQQTLGTNAPLRLPLCQNAIIGLIHSHQCANRNIQTFVGGVILTGLVSAACLAEVPLALAATALSGGGGSGGGGGGGGGAGTTYYSGGGGGGGCSPYVADLQAEVNADEGVCARVRIRIDQQAVMTRAAFVGELGINNQYQLSSLNGVQLTLDFRDENGASANDKFTVVGPELSGVSAVDGTGVIAGASTGNVKYTFIPNREAAPNAPAGYSIGGVLRYIDPGSGLEVVVPLLGATITVLPDPILNLKYFQQRDVYGDDPFTDEIEPSEPFDLGLIVTNTGRGTAKDFTITSAQPKIIENEKGLLIDFKIVGTQVGNQTVQPTLTACSARSIRVHLRSQSGR